MITITIGGLVATGILCFIAGTISGIFLIALTSANGDDEECEKETEKNE